ncbi:MAG TPA: hypothetical protein DCS43_05050 [Verrucomicrobia bacterium]|nr:hypothetical protein [Verrucomicrobiota bacterium]
MAKFLRVLVVFIFIFSIGALILGSMLFVKREILKGRAHKLEQGLIRLARTLEDQPPADPETPAVYPERDISGVSAELIESPTLTQFWATYKQRLESLDQPTVDLSPEAKQRALMSYYKIDPTTGEPERNKVTNLKISEGEGTTQGVIDHVIERASEQYNILTETRQLLQVTRAELVTTILDLNQQKQTLRERLVHIVKLNNDIAELNRVIEGLRNELQQARDEIEQHKQTIAALEQDKIALQEKIDDLTIKTEQQGTKIKELLDQLHVRNQGGETTGEMQTGGINITTTRINIAAGVKGRVVSVDQRYLFVVMELDEKFVSELLSTLTDENLLPMVDLLVQRPAGDKPLFVTKVRLTQLNNGKTLAIGEILADWQQMPIEPGDTIFYQ